MRLQAYLARSGLASRRAAERLILEGRVEVNGQIVRELGTKVGPLDSVVCDGVVARLESARRYIALNKPPGYICALSDPEGRPLAASLIQGYDERLYNVGRLDYLSSGLILFTNDGDFAKDISHPSTMVEKEYYVEARKPIPRNLLDSFLRGVVVEGVRYTLSRYEMEGPSAVRLVLIEGKNREIRRVLRSADIYPQVLRRVRIGPIALGDLAEGSYRELGEEELHDLEALRARAKAGRGEAGR